jgi:ABC-type Na+ transport system ATPase subunit NatA
MDLRIHDVTNIDHHRDQAPIVILATYLIEDISELCGQWAILNRGEEARTIARRTDEAECHHEAAVHL